MMKIMLEKAPLLLKEGEEDRWALAEVKLCLLTGHTAAVEQHCGSCSLGGVCSVQGVAV